MKIIEFDIMSGTCITSCPHPEKATEGKISKHEPMVGSCYCTSGLTNKRIGCPYSGGLAKDGKSVYCKVGE